MDVVIDTYSHASTWTCMHTREHVNVHACIRASTCMHTREHVNVHTCIRASTWTYIPIHTLTHVCMHRETTHISLQSTIKSSHFQRPFSRKHTLSIESTPQYFRRDLSQKLFHNACLMVYVRRSAIGRKDMQTRKKEKETQEKEEQPKKQQRKRSWTEKKHNWKEEYDSKKKKQKQEQTKEQEQTKAQQQSKGLCCGFPLFSTLKPCVTVFFVCELQDEIEICDVGGLVDALMRIPS
jgi:hypothetical protein